MERWAFANGQRERQQIADVKIRTYTPSTLRADAPDVLYLPGLFTKADDHSSQLISEAFGERSGGMTYSMSADPYRITQNSVQQEAQEIFDKYSELRTARGVTKRKPVIIVGHSHGGDVGISVTKLFEDQKIPVAGLVLLNTRGLSDEHSLGLAAGIKDEIVRTSGIYFNPPRILQPDRNPEMRKNVRNLVTDLRNGIARDVFSRKLHKKVDACSYINPDAEKIKANIEVILGADDVLAHPSHIIPSENSDPYISNWQERGQYLRNNIFKKSKNISVHVARHGGVHALPVLRPETVANVALISLQRMQEVPQRRRTLTTQTLQRAA